jgi:hypothetical protein
MDTGQTKSSARILTLAAFAAVIVLAGCSLFRWNAKPDVVQGDDWDSSEMRPSTAPARARPAAPTPSVFDEEVSHYADLGPSEIDVSAYPSQQKYNYKLFKQSCGLCHTTARAVNSETQSRLYWRFHLARMNMHARFQGAYPLTPLETQQVLDFLVFDAKVRKVEKRAEFYAQTEELKRRYDAVLRKKMRALQSPGQPRILEPVRP